MGADKYVYFEEDSTVNLTMLGAAEQAQSQDVVTEQASGEMTEEQRIVSEYVAKLNEFVESSAENAKALDVVPLVKTRNYLKRTGDCYNSETLKTLTEFEQRLYWILCQNPDMMFRDNFDLMEKEDIAKSRYVSSIYELVTERNGKNTITSMYHLYEEKHKRNDFDLVVTEDSNSGYEMAKYAFDSEKMRVISAGGNASVYRTLMKNGGENDQICVDVDGAAFGPYIEPVLKFAELQGTISVSAPESFEFILLHLDSVMKHLSLDHGELSRTYDFCDSKDFITWERYYENLLNEITTEHLGFSYGKSKLNPYFLNGRCAELFIEQICKSFIKRRE